MIKSTYTIINRVPQEKLRVIVALILTVTLLMSIMVGLHWTQNNSPQWINEVSTY